MIAAIEAKNPNALREAFKGLARENLFFPPDDWSMFVDAVRGAGNSAVLAALWEASVGSRARFRTDDVWAKFAVTSLLVGSDELLAEIISAAKALTADNRFEYGRFWKACIRHYSDELTLPDVVFAEFCDRALSIEHEKLLGEVLDGFSSAGVFLPRDAWNRLTTLALQRPNPQTTHVLWQGTLPSRNFLSHYEFGLFAELAVVLSDVPLLNEVLSVVALRQMFLSREIWNRLLQVALQRPEPAIVKALWHGSESSREFLTAWDFGHFAQLGEALADIGLLEMFFDGWTPAQDTLGAAEHPTWGTFLKAAEALGAEELIVKMVCRLETHFDPVRYHDRGTLQEHLREMRDRMNDRTLAEELAGVLRGDHWSIERFFLVLRAFPPRWHSTPAAAGPFEGAARCLMRWLINRFFKSSPETFNADLHRVVNGLFALRANKVEAFFALLCRGYENCAGNITHRFRHAYLSQVAFVATLSEAEIADRISEITTRLGEFERLCDTVVPESGDGSALTPEPTQQALIQHVVDRQVSYLEGHSSDALAFWTELRVLFDGLSPATMARDAWVALFRSLIATLSHELAPKLREQFKQATHRVKDDFHRDFEQPLLSSGLPEQRRMAIASEARAFIGSAGPRLRRRGLGAELPFNLAAAVKRCLFVYPRREIVGHLSGAEQPVWIAGREGIRRGVIEPMLNEISENCRRAFEAVPPDRQFFEVSISHGIEAEPGFVLLNVINSRPEGELPYARSTNLGLGFIQALARSVRRGGREGDAFFETACVHPETNQPIFKTTIRFPAWDGPAPDVGDTDVQ